MLTQEQFQMAFAAAKDAHTKRYYELMAAIDPNSATAAADYAARMQKFRGGSFMLVIQEDGYCTGYNRTTGSIVYPPFEIFVAPPAAAPAAAAPVNDMDAALEALAANFAALQQPPVRLPPALLHFAAQPMQAPGQISQDECRRLHMVSDDKWMKRYYELMAEVPAHDIVRRNQIINKFRGGSFGLIIQDNGFCTGYRRTTYTETVTKSRKVGLWR